MIENEIYHYSDEFYINNTQRIVIAEASLDLCKSMMANEPDYRCMLLDRMLGEGVR